MKLKKILIAAAVAMFVGTLLAGGHGDVPPYPNFGLPRVEEMMFLVLQIGVILFAAKIGGSIASILHMPSILGELGAGILIGPWALGGIGFCPEYFGGLFKDGLFHGAALREMQAQGHMFDATSPALYGIATLASIILLFLSGLETNLKMFLRYSFVGLMVGLGGVLFSFIFGDLCAVYFLPMFFHNVEWIQELSRMPLSEAMMQAGPLYMGIMSTATSVGITARILSERKKMDSEEGVSIMAGAVIDDVLGLIVLAIGNGIIAANMEAKATGASGGVDWGDIGMVAVKAFGVWLGGTLIGIVFARKISWLLKLVKNPKVIGTLAFGLSMIVAGFFESMGLAMIIGAYVMGLSLSRTDLKHLIQENLDPVYTFLVPIFFCVMGMMVDVTALCSKPVIYFGAIYTALAIGAKIVGCALPSFWCGFNLLGGLRIGAGMVPRGEVALIIAGLGLSKGYLTSEIFGIGIMMTLITTVAAPPALVTLFHSSRRGVKKPKPPEESSRQVSFGLPNAEVAGIMMEKLVQQFRKEGFFTYRLNEEGTLYHVTMDSYEITMLLKDNDIKVECTPAEGALVKQAWAEVVSQMNALALAISKPSTTVEETMKELLDNDGDEGVSGAGGVARTVSNFVMIPDFKADNKRDAIEKLTKAIAERYPKIVKNPAKLTEAVMTRESAMPTGLDHGIAVPHGRTDAVTDIVGAVALIDNSGKETGSIADYETIDHSVLKIIVLTVAPETAPSPYLQLMAFVSRTLRSEDGYLKLAECKNENQMRKFFRSAK